MSGIRVLYAVRLKAVIFQLVDLSVATRLQLASDLLFLKNVNIVIAIS